MVRKAAWESRDEPKGPSRREAGRRALVGGRWIAGAGQRGRVTGRRREMGSPCAGAGGRSPDAGAPPQHRVCCKP
jgi:hypothetical protein